MSAVKVRIPNVNTRSLREHSKGAHQRLFQSSACTLCGGTIAANWIELKIWIQGFRCSILDLDKRVDDVLESLRSKKDNLPSESHLNLEPAMKERD